MCRSIDVGRDWPTGSRLIASLLVALALVGLELLPPPAARAGQAGTLVIRATGFQNGQGRAMARLYRSGDNVRGEPYRIAFGSIHAGRAELRFAGLARGAYAVIVVHDLNANSRIDHDVLGMAAEPLGFSNSFVLGLTSGMPSFEKLKFDFNGGDQAIEIRMSWRSS